MEEKNWPGTFSIRAYRYADMDSAGLLEIDAVRNQPLVRRSGKIAPVMALSEHRGFQ